MYESPPHGDVVERDAALLAGNLVRGFGYSQQLVELSGFQPDCAREVSGRPVASGFARLLAASGQRLVTNRRHDRVILSEGQRQLLASLDGNQSVEDLREWARSALATPDATLPDTWVDEQLRWFAESALLIA